MDRNCSAPRSRVLAQVAVLLLHLGKGGRQPPHDALIGDLVHHVATDDEPKVEDELIPIVSRIGNGDRVSQDDVLAVRIVDGDEAVAKGLARDDVLLEHAEVEETWLLVKGTIGAFWKRNWHD